MRRSAAPRALLLAAVLGLGLASGPAGDPPPVAGVGPLPECRLDDIFTEPRGYDDWAITQVDWILTLGEDYRPPDLVNVRDAGVRGSGLVRQVAFDDLAAMAAAAEKNGTPLVSWSAFRGYNQQVRLFNGYAGWIESEQRYTNFDGAVTFSARPGHSEHQTGLTIDFVAVGDTGLTSNWEVTRTGGWMAKNAWKYGWLMSYPEGEKPRTCYRYEPWHYRYVGRDLAAKIRESGLTIREYLWANFTQVDPACVALPPPPLETPGTPRSCALAEASPSPGGTAGPSGEPSGAPPSPDPGSPAASAPTSPTAVPGATAAPAPTGILGQALPIGVALVGAVLALLAFALWRSSRRAARRRW